MLQPGFPSDTDSSRTAHRTSATGSGPGLAMLQPLNLKKDVKAPDCAQCPSCLGNPASMLPFLTAQANSVFSMALGNQGSFPSAGGILTPSTHILPCGSGSDGKQSTASDLSSVGLDLGNGWKVVGLTSLAAPPVQMPSSVQLPQSVAVSSSCSELGTQDASNLTTTRLPEPAALNKSGCVLNTPPMLPSSISGEWKVVGLTSLNQGNSDISRDSNTAAVPVQNLTLPDSVPTCGAIDFSLNNSKAKQNEQHKPSDLANNLGNNLNLPSLADVAAGTSDWKIAGVTTLLSPVEASGACESSKVQSTASDTAAPAAQPAVAPDVSLTDTAEWKVVGVTSLSSPPINSAPVATSSNTPPTPLVMASAPPMVTMPLSPSAAKDMVWKVVGMVPLPQQAETLPKNTASPALDERQTCTISDLPAQSQSSSEELDEVAQIPISTRIPGKDCVKKSWMSSGRPVSISRELTSRCLDRREDPHHPLGFLKNCSNKFRNAVLKRNTVSTMLELKRAYQDIDKKEKQLDFSQERNHHSVSKNLMYFVLKRLSKSTKCKSVGYNEFTEENSDQGDISSFHQNTRQKQDDVKVGADRNCISEDEMFCRNPPKSNDLVLGNHSTPLSVTDDKLALSMAYRSQMESGMDPSFSSTPPHPHSPYQESEDFSIPAEEHQRFSDIPLKTMKNEDGHMVTSLRSFDSDAVNLTSVDPWGVCTSDSLGDMSEMMMDKGENKTHQSSSRKRKLTTPRKMIQ